MVNVMADRVKITGTQNFADALGCWHRLQKSEAFHALRENVQGQIMATWLTILSHWGTAPVSAVAKVRGPNGTPINIPSLVRLRFIETTAEAWPSLMEPNGQTPLLPGPMGTADVPAVVGPSADVIAINRFVQDWNQAAAQLELRSVVTLTDKRRKAIRDRLNDPWWRDHYRDGLQRMAKSQFLRGFRQSGKQKPFKANMDWFTREDTLAKLLEGAYDD